MLYLLGTGINDEFDLTLREIEILKKSDEVLFENYTSLSRINIHNLEKIINNKIKLCSRSDIENDEELILKRAKEKDISILVIGDPLIATTHVMYLVDAFNEKIELKVINNVSVLNAVSKTGLEMYKFGRIVSIPWQESSSFFEYLSINLKNNLHTLCLLDIDAQNNRFMNFKEAIQKLKKLDFSHNINEIVVCCALGTDDERIIFGNIDEISEIECEAYPQCIIVPSKMHFMEKESLERFKNGN